MDHSWSRIIETVESKVVDAGDTDYLHFTINMFTEEETEAQRGTVTHLWLYSY